jgi:hypothetical protein
MVPKEVVLVALDKDEQTNVVNSFTVAIEVRNYSFEPQSDYSLGV